MPDVDEASAVPVEMTAGQLSLAHPRIVHGSGPNLSQRRRLGFAIQSFIAPDVDQVIGKNWAQLARGEDRYATHGIAGHPKGVMNPDDIAFRNMTNEELQNLLCRGGTEGKIWRTSVMTDLLHIAAAEAGHINARLVSNRAHTRQAFPDAPHLLNNANMGRALTPSANGPAIHQHRLWTCRKLLRHCGVARVVYKDESTRLGLGAFKALGGAYAVADLVREQVAKGANVGEVTVATATDGNHGRSVAWGAQLAGCNAKIYIHEHVSRAREAAMQAYGASVVCVQGNYEVSLADCRADAEANGCVILFPTLHGRAMSTYQGRLLATRSWAVRLLTSLVRMR